MIFLHLFLGASLLASPHYRPAALAIQTIIHLAGAAFGSPDARAWHLLVAATGLLFVDPTSLRDTIERIQVWLQPAVSYDAAARRGRGRGQGRGGGARGGQRGGRGGSERLANGSDWSSSQQGAAAPGCSVSCDDVSSSAADGAGAREGKSSSSGGGGSARPKKRLPLQPKPSSAAAALISLYVLLQVLLPLRHALGEFPVEWSREGHEFSWRAGGGVGGRGGGGGLVREEGLVRIMHRPRERGGGAGRGAAAAGVQTVHLYGSPLTAQQVRSLVVVCMAWLRKFPSFLNAFVHV